VGGTDWAVGSAAGSETNITALGAVTALPLTGGVSTTNYQLTAAGQSQSGTVTANSLKITGGEGNTLDLGTNPLTFTSGGGLLSTVNYTISGSGAGILGAGSANEFIVNVKENNLTISAPIIGSATAGSLTKAGAGTLTLTGTNSYTGSTYLTAGVLRATAGTGLPTASNLQFVGGVLESSGAATFTRALGTGAGQVYWNGGSGGFSAYSTGPAGDKMTVNIGNALGTMTWGGTNFVPDGFNLRFGSTNANRETEFQNPINLGNWPRTVEVRSGAGGDKATLSGAITGTGAGGLVKTGSGVLALSNAGNTFSGGIQVKAGTVSVGADSNLGSPLSEFYGVTLDAGTLQIAGTSAFSTAKSIRLNSGGGTIDAVNSNITPPALSGAISGTGGLIKTGTGALVLSSANVTYTGATTVKAGVLFVNTLLSSTSGVSVQTSGTLAGTGTISAPVTIDSGAFLSPGASIGQLNLSNGITIHGQLDAEISWSPTTTSDVLALTGGNLVLDSDTSILNVIGDLAGAPPFTEYTIATVSGGGTVTGTFKTLKNNGNPGLPPMWSVLITTNSIKVIPEPATMALLGLGGVAMLLGRRRSRKS
jgi:autotransporter-associated beta strand protein